MPALRKRRILARANNSCAFNRSLTALPNEIHGAQLCFSNARSAISFYARLLRPSKLSSIGRIQAWDWGLKLEKLWTAVTLKIMNFYRRVNDRWKRGTFFFKILSRLSRYDSRFSRYRRAKEKVIFRRSPVSFHSPLARIIEPNLTQIHGHNRRGNNVSRRSIRNLRSKTLNLRRSKSNRKVISMV